MQTKTIKTAIYLDEDLFYKAKMEAIKRKQTLKEFITLGVTLALKKDFGKKKKVIPRSTGII